MDNHIHLLIKENDESISQAMKRISSSYVFWYNQKYERCGHLFQDRFKSEVVETDEYFLVVLRYIHQNLLKAGMTKDIRYYIWSSYKEYMNTPTIVDINFALDIFSEDRNKAVELFKTFSNEETTDECLDNRKTINLSDIEVLDYLQKVGNVTSSQLLRIKREDRDDILRKIKDMQGVTIRQLARITGVSKSVIDRV